MSTVKTTTISTLDGTYTVPAETLARGACRAWCNFNGTGTVAIRASFNVSSITDNGTGNYTVNFTTAMPDVNYAVCGSSQDNNSSGTTTFTSYSRTAGSIVVVTATTGTDTLFDSEVMNVAIFR
jgi:hypothetical protein